MTAFAELMEAQDQQAAAIVTKQLDAEGWQINPNDVGWLYHYPQIDKQLGRAKRVYDRVSKLSN